MAKNERQEMILEILRECKCITPQKLAERIYTSYSSIRRDLEELENLGLVVRSYGNVELTNSNSTFISYPMRINRNSAQKKNIAKKAAALIKDGDTIFIDPSSSCSFFARELIYKRGITIVTNNVEITGLMTQSSINVICSGGIQTSPNRYALIGPIAEDTFRKVHADWVVFSARSLTADGLIYDVHYSETAIRKIMLENADKKLFLCDSSKLKTSSPYFQCSLSEIDYMACDSKEVKCYLKDYPNLKLL